MKQEKLRFYRALRVPLVFAGIMWAVFLLEQYAGFHWSQFGIQPRSLPGLRGVLFSPFLHADWEHLLSNTFPVLALGTMLFYFFPKISFELLIWQWLIGGLWLWSFGRTGSTHIGASGLVYAMAFFLLISGFIRKNRALTVISLIVVMLYGSLVWGVFPVDPGISWDGHLMGMLCGVLLAILFRRKGPANDPPKVWDDSDLDGVEPYWEVDNDKIEENARPFTIRYRYTRKSEKPEDS